MREFTITKEPLKSKQKDTIRIKGGNLDFSLSVFNGKQGDHFLCYCPTLNISGYGSTEKEAEDFIKVEMKVFCEDIMAMPTDERESYLLSLGFKKERFRKKNFSKAYIDENGRLQDFDEGTTVERKILQVA